jgi:hypothetical protein
MSTLMDQVERFAAAGRTRASVPGVVAPAGTATSTIGCGWVSNPPAMQVETAKRHDLTPAPRPEEALP